MTNIKSLGVLEFSDKGILFVGDNLAGAIHAIDLTAESRATDSFEVYIYEIYPPEMKIRQM